MLLASTDGRTFALAENAYSRQTAGTEDIQEIEMKRNEMTSEHGAGGGRHFFFLAMMLVFVGPSRVSVADVPFLWYRPVSGSFNSPGPWLAGGEETRNPVGSIKDPNPNKKIPGGSDSVGFPGDAFAAYEVSIFGIDVKHFEVSGSFNLPYQPITLNISGTMSAGYLTSVAPSILKGGGELYGKQSVLGPNQVVGMTVTGGTTLRVEDGNINGLNLVDNSTAVLSDVFLQNINLTDSTLKTGAKITGSSVSLSRSVWEHNGSGFGSLGIATLNMDGGSRFNTEGAVTLNNLVLKESSSFTAGSLTNPFKGISVSGSGLFAKSAVLNGRVVVFGPNNTELIMSPADITKDSKVELGTMELEQRWLRVSDRSKLRNGTAKMGTKGSAGILVDDKGSEWTVTNQVDAAGNVRVRRGGFVQFGMVNKLSALVENTNSELQCVLAFNAESLRATGGAIIRGQGIDLQSGSSESSAIYLTNAFNLGMAKSSSFAIAEGGYLECRIGIRIEESQKVAAPRNALSRDSVGRNEKILRDVRSHGWCHVPRGRDISGQAGKIDTVGGRLAIAPNRVTAFIAASDRGVPSFASRSRRQRSGCSRFVRKG